jgi:phosphoribosylformimino-5-aminoimidazole carboxamide ribotide isomerase
MEIIPAIDLRNSKCVRLFQGDYGQETIFSDGPVSVALRWQSEGARRLHIVDLDGAAKGEPVNLETIEDIIAAIDIPVEVGGGIRSIETIEQLFAAGVERAILGTVAVEKPDLVKEACQRFGDRIIISIDAKDRMVATRGWLQKSTVTASELASKMIELGVMRFIYTDISRDGTLTSPNFEAIAELLSQVNVSVIAAGGISSVQHLTKLAELGVEGAIVGKAIYTGDVKLSEAFKAIRELQSKRQGIW